ncbi:unnamed protein product [Penicillium nalgiovense]|uniref:Uncharacterized protein n=2 Tax=Penicillium TaxID=5073 RepID=A0A9W4I2M9_PENNA|nr:unnamed protein product [Penicillium nalgiovense]CAG8070357.1 unnamed protein product [Penicillium salamii]CAG8026233.1 unnamed protein product [Penicillium nalgiovense]CAG8077167.1 unnamed protein product [Penicillium salamii]CAG8088708.1 unnamed protein product [Penicillium salamii]
MSASVLRPSSTYKSFWSNIPNFICLLFFFFFSYLPSRLLHVKERPCCYPEYNRVVEPTHGVYIKPLDHQCFLHSRICLFFTNQLNTQFGMCDARRMGHLDRIDYDLDLDLDSIWREFPNVPSPPPCLAANHHSLRLVRPNTAPKHARYGERSPFIECLFYPSYESECSFSWTGPDPLSPDTCTDDMFLYVSAFFILERVDWIELRLSKLSMATKEVVEEYPFFLPRVESMLGNLPRARGQIHDIILQSSHVESVGQPRFQLSMWPRTESSQNSAMRGTIPLSYLDSSMHISSLNPQLFVQNIVGNWGT